MKILKLFYLGIALLLSISIGYSKLEQQLLVSCTANVITQPQNQYTYSYDLYPWDPSYHYYDYNQLTLTYTGNDTSITSWVMTVATPPDVTMIDELCVNCKYSYSSGTLKIYSTTNNGLLLRPGECVSFEVCFKSLATDYQLNVTDVSFYSRDTPNPNLTSISGQYTLTKGTGSGTTENYNYPYTFSLKNNTNYDFYDWEVIIPFNTSTMTLSNAVNFNYVIKNGNLYIYGSGIPKDTTRNTSFNITYSSSPIPDLIVTSFIGKALILS